MKYNGYGNIAKTYSNFWLNYIKTLFLTNIRLAYWTPKKAILHSVRMQTGEKFLLTNKLLYPYELSPASYEEANKTLNLSISLENSLVEADYFINYTSIDRIRFHNKLTEEIFANIKEKTNLLSKTILVEEEKDLDLPVAVYARLIFSQSIQKIGNLDYEVSEEVYEKSLRLFLKKLKFADSNSLSMVVFSLAHKKYKDSKTWELLFKKLENTFFESEFTKVNNYSPHLFKYRELDLLKKKDFQEEFALKIIKQGLSICVENKVSGVTEIISNLNERIKI
jgi:hypothetical protein